MGGAGNDTYYVDSSTDVVTEAASSGTDSIITALGYSLSTLGNIENLTLSGTGNVNATGNAVANALTGNSGNNALNGGDGNDTLTGGAGQDTFRFDSILNGSTNVDRITDFVVADDTIQLENSIFTKFGSSTIGSINSAYFTANTTGVAADSNDYIIYETDTGKLFYDADGNGAGTSVQIALLGANLTLTSADFVLV